MLRSLTIEPAGDRWADLITVSQKERAAHTLLERPLSEWIALTRRELLASSAPCIIATGHQSAFWHPGILAKYFALDACAATLAPPAACLELVVDQDDNDPLSLTLPMSPLAAPDALNLHDLALGPSILPDPSDIPTGLRPPSDPFDPFPLPPDARPAGTSVSEGLRTMCAALYARRLAPSLALQVALAGAQLRGHADLTAQPSASLLFASPSQPPRFVIPSSHLTSSSLWTALVLTARRDPLRLHHLYNHAVAAHPDAGVAPLARIDGDVELPFWVIDESSALDGPPRRIRATASHLSSSPHALWPRGIFLTGFTRLVLCDLFIHGTGGARYDLVTERLFRDWLNVSLAPATLVTATVTLDLGEATATAADLARASWLAHQVRFDFGAVRAPGLPALGSDELATLQKQRANLLDHIASLPRRSAQRSASFHQLHELRRAANAGPLAPRIQAADALVTSVQARLARRAILEARDWAFPLYPASDISALKLAVTNAFQPR